MSEVRREVRTFKVQLKCNICGESMSFDGHETEQLTNSHFIQHRTYRCPNGHKVVRDNEYPRTEYEEIEEKPNSIYFKPRTDGGPPEPNWILINNVEIRARAIDEMCAEAKGCCVRFLSTFHSSDWISSLCRALDLNAARLKGEK